MRVDNLIAAIAHPARRQMLTMTRAGERTSSQLAHAIGLTRPAASQHLRVLRDAGLVSVRRQGGYRYYRAQEDRVEALRSFLEDFCRTPVPSTLDPVPSPRAPVPSPLEGEGQGGG